MSSRVFLSLRPAETKPLTNVTLPVVRRYAIQTFSTPVHSLIAIANSTSQPSLFFKAVGTAGRKYDWTTAILWRLN
jgi:hypothetical protein